MNEVYDDIIYELEKQYKFKLPTQMVLLILIMVVMFIGLEYAPFSMEIKITSYIIILSLVFPVIVNVKTKWQSAIAFGLWGTASILLIVWTIDLVEFGNLGAIGLYIAFLEIILIEFLHHIGIEIITKDKKGYILDVVLTLIFFVSISLFLYQISWSWIIYAGVSLSVIFAYAILPERKV